MSNTEEYTKKDIGRKAGIYGGNYIAGVIANSIGLNLSGPISKISGNVLEKIAGIKSGLANPIGGIFWGAVDVTRGVFPALREKKYFQILEGVGALYYAGSTVADLVSILKGNWGALAQLPFDAAMGYEVGKNFAKDIPYWKPIKWGNKNKSIKEEDDGFPAVK